MVTVFMTAVVVVSLYSCLLLLILPLTITIVVVVFAGPRAATFLLS